MGLLSVFGLWVNVLCIWFVWLFSIFGLWVWPFSVFGLCDRFLYLVCERDCFLYSVCECECFLYSVCECDYLLHLVSARWVSILTGWWYSKRVIYNFSFRLSAFISEEALWTLVSGNKTDVLLLINAASHKQHTRRFHSLSCVLFVPTFRNWTGSDGPWSEPINENDRLYRKVTEFGQSRLRKRDLS